MILSAKGWNHRKEEGCNAPASVRFEPFVSPMRRDWRSKVEQDRERDKDVARERSRQACTIL